MDFTRKAALGIATLGIALGAGHLVQDRGQTAPAPTATAAAPTGIVPLAATDVPQIPALAALLPDLPAPPVLLAPAGLPAAAAPASTAEVAAEIAAAPDPCAMTLAVTPGTGAMLDITLLAPCTPGARVVLRHGGLAVTALTSKTGSLFTRLPALATDGAVSIRFGNGARAEAAAAIDLTGLRRVAVQWQAQDRFALNAFENGAAWGEPGHLSAARPTPGGGRLIALGDASVPLPMLAEVYTYPAETTAPVEVTVEAEVTPATCNRELLGEAIESYSGSVSSVDLTLAMPDCDATGDFLVLNNLWSGPTLASAD